jgi:hypothetical protein
MGFREFGRLKGGEGRGNVHLRSFLRRHPRESRVLEDASVEELHDVEVAAHHALVLAESIGFGYGDIGLLEGVDDAVFAVDLVRGLGSSVYMPRCHDGKVRTFDRSLPGGFFLMTNFLPFLSVSWYVGLDWP